MRTFFVTAVVVAALWVLDVWAFESRYSKAVWAHATDQGTMFQYQVHYVLRKLD
jgi:hypothetical protein